MLELLSHAVCDSMENPRSGRADQGRPGVVGPVGQVRDGMAPPAACWFFGVRWLDTALALWLSGCRSTTDPRPPRSQRLQAKNPNSQSGVEPPHSKKAA